MFTVTEFEYNTPIGKVNRATLILDGKQLISYEGDKGSANAIAGLILELGKFRREALDSIHTKLMEETE